MAIGTANTTQLSYIKEVTPGTTPSTPAMTRIRYTGESLNSNITTTESQEIRDDRATSDLVLTDQSNGGDVNTELSGAVYDDFLAAALFADAAWTSVDVTAATIAATATGFTDSGSGFVSAGIQVGQFIKFAGFSNAALNRVYRVTSVAAGVLVTYPVPVATEAASASVTYTGSTIKSGKTDHSFTIQKAHTSLATPAYQNYRGMRVASMTQSLTVGSIATMGFTFLGQSSEVTTSQIAGRTEVAAATNAVMNSVSNVSEITAVGGSLSAAVKFTDLSFNYDNALRELKAIGTLGSIDVRSGTINATATINPYFENIEMLEAFLANESFVLSWKVEASDGYAYVFSFPNVKFQTQELAAGGRDTDMIINAGVRAILDSSSGTTMRIDRFVP